MSEKSSALEGLSDDDLNAAMREALTDHEALVAVLAEKNRRGREHAQVAWAVTVSRALARPHRLSGRPREELKPHHGR